MTSDRVFRDAKIIIPESQYSDYKKHHYYNGCELLPIPDEFDGNVARKRNWVLDNIGGNVVIVDDDYSHIGKVENGKYYELDKDQVEALLFNGFQMCEDLGSVLWGLNLQADKRFYREYSPFSMLAVVLGPFHAFMDCPLRYDERLPLKEDYDMALQVLQRYHKVLRFNKYYYVVDHFSVPGGVNSYRMMDREREQLRLLQKKWGKDVVKFNEKKDVDPIIKVPLKGI